MKIDHSWIEKFYDKLEESKYAAINDDMKIPEDSDDLDYTYMKAGYNKGVTDAIKIFSDLFHRHCKKEIADVEKEIEILEEKDLSDKEQESVQKLRTKLENQKNKMKIIDEVREEGDEE